MANKGGLYLRLKIDYEQIAVFNCHLAAGMKSKSYMKRQENLLALATFMDSQNDLSLSFIIGDMNFRTALSCDEAEQLLAKYIQTQERNESLAQLQKLLDSDELLEYMKYSKGTVLEKFIEAPICFMPSYKWNVGSNTYNFDSGKRPPSW